ncbi:hypothetical protein SSX86_027550 [Deinandra increscens subsp. villosa]|uniref:DUF1421 domain-containing protein n=1 Tax=Deinandra increscens subsp. villosa TaxID=3103831 RepID=A0AAP0GKF4_9ASTR
MASGSSKGFDFASDDILSSCEDHTNQEQSTTDSVAKQEFNKSRHDSDDQEAIILAVEKSMKKHTEKVMRSLEGLGSRLSQVRSDLIRDHEEADSKLKFLEKHLQEVHRSLQIWMIDLQVAETEKELAKLQLAQKESSSSHTSPQTNDRSSTPDAHKKKPQRAPEPQAYYPPPAPTQYQQSQMQPQPLQQQWQMTSYSTIPPPRSYQPMSYSYGRTAQPQPPPPPHFGTQRGDGYLSPSPYNKVVDKLVSMGYQRDHVVGVIQRLDETGQIADVNVVLDRLNGGGPQIGWSG